MAKNPQTGLNDTGVTRSMTWGPDLSGTEQGAGGLLWTFDDNDDGVIPGYDGNGNIIAWVDISDGSLAGTREYGAFGEDVTFSGVSLEILFGFSTKYQDSLSGLYYYGYRYYNASSGRWLSRDPMGEQGGVNLYGFVGNNGVNAVDLLGLWSSPNMSFPQMVAQGMSARDIALVLGIPLATATAMVEAEKLVQAAKQKVEQLERDAKGKDPCERARDAVKRAEKSIKSFEKNIDKHEKYINDPNSYPGGLQPPYDQFPERAIKDWQGDIRKAKGEIKNTKKHWMN
jgi:RHS repeat-associated protein